MERFDLLSQLSNLSANDVFFAPLVITVAIFWLYCLFLAFSQSLLFSSKISARDYFIAGGSLSTLMFIAAATATSFSGWTFSSHPGAIYEYGFAAAFASFYAITIPLSGVFFLKRQWMLGKRCGFVTPGEMFYAYFKSDVMRYLVLVVALLFSILYLALQLRASGYLFSILTDGKLTVESGTLLLSAILFVYVVVGGLRTVAYIDTMQLLLKAAGIMTLGYIVWHYGGLSDMARLANFHQYFHDTAKHFTVPEGLWYANKATAIAATETGESYWTVTFIFTFLFALMGIQTSPAFTMWAFATKTPNAFGYQQVFSSLVMGFILIFFTAMIGIGSHFLGADYALNENIGNEKNILGLHLDDRDLLKGDFSAESLVPMLIRMTLDISPFLMGILAMMALAAVQSTAASYMSTMGSMLSRDLLKNGWCTDRKVDRQGREVLAFFTVVFIVILGRLSFHSSLALLFFFIVALIAPIALYFVVKAIARAIRYPMTFGDSWQKWSAAFFTFSITVIAIAVALTATDTLAFMGALAVAYGVQMMPALIAICWWSYLTEWGVIIGLIVGLIVVTLTELTPAIFPLAIGQWPGTIHSAAWGFAFNFALAVIISTVQKRLNQDTEAAHRQQFHRFLNDPFLKNTDKLNYQPKNQPNWWLILGVVFLWAFCAFGLARWGNTLFGDPTDAETWLFGIPSLWAWQIGWWAIGVGMMYWLAFKQNLACWSEAEEEQEIQPLQLDVSESKDLYCENIYPARGQ